MINEHDIKDMCLDEYQEKAGKYQVPTAPPEERVMGLLEEAGEVAGIFKRLMRGDYELPEASAKLEKELGDLIWYIARVAADNGWKLSEVCQTNLDKLESRWIRNQLVGTGSER